MLFEVLERMIKNEIKSRGEYQLTDSLQEMINQGCRLKTFEISSWYDCGHAKSLLDTNHVLLNENKDMNGEYEINEIVIIRPVAIEKNVKFNNSVIVPDASIAEGTIVESSIISNSVNGVDVC